MSKLLVKAFTVSVGPVSLIAAPSGQQKAPVPVYEVEATWPKMPLPNKWMMQSVPVMATCASAG